MKSMRWSACVLVAVLSACKSAPVEEASRSSTRQPRGFAWSSDRPESLDGVPESGDAPLTVMTPPNGSRAPASVTSELLNLPKSVIRCREVGREGASTREDCVYPTPNGDRTLHVLTLSGTFAENAYAHGKLMSKEIEGGSLNEALENVAGFKKGLKPLPLRAFEGLFGCYEKKMMNSASDEFVEGVKQLHAGYLAGARAENRTPKFPEEESLLTATFSIEMGNLLGGVIHRASEKLEKVRIDGELHKLGRRGGKADVFAGVAFDCGLNIATRVVRDLDDIIVEKGQLKEKFACTGIVATPDWTSDGRLIHGRNLEQTSMINTWNRYPTIFLIEEKPDPSQANGKKKSKNGKDPSGLGYRRYVGFGTAGLIFPGGISGFNDAGLTVSLHQFGSTYVEAKHPRGSAAMMPFLQQRLLREASTIEEAEAIIKQTNVYSAWAILVGDSKTGSVASFEITPKGAVRARYAKGYMAQVNMYLHPEKQKEHYHGRYNSLLENTSRFTIADRELKQAHKKMDLGRAVNLLANHEDLYEGERTFGRSIARTSNIMSSIVIPDPKNGGGEAYMTIADSLPPVHGYYAGFDVDFAKLKLIPNGAVKNASYKDRQDRERSFHEYHLAYQSFAKHTVESTTKAVELLHRSQTSAKNNGIDDPVYPYLIARFALNAAEADPSVRQQNGELAVKHFSELERIADSFHPIRKANVLMLGMRARDLIGDTSLSDAERRSRYEFAKGVLTAIVTNRDEKWIPKMHGHIHAPEDLVKKHEIWEQIYARERDTPKKSGKNGKSLPETANVLKPIKLQDVDMSTVD